MVTLFSLAAVPKLWEHNECFFCCSGVFAFFLFFIEEVRFEILFLPHWENAVISLIVAWKQFLLWAVKNFYLYNVSAEIEKFDFYLFFYPNGCQYFFNYLIQQSVLKSNYVFSVYTGINTYLCICKFIRHEMLESLFPF